MALHMQRLMREAGHDVPASKSLLEINPSHPLLKRFEAEADGDRAADLGMLLFEEAQLAEGATLDDPASFIRRLNRIIGATD